LVLVALVVAAVFVLVALVVAAVFVLVAEAFD
jgi:hypothetical protein